MDPPAKGQKALPFELVKRLIDRPTKDPAGIRLSLLFLMAFFFAMRSCEYVKVVGPRRTLPVRKMDITFIKDRRVVPHHSPSLHLADTVSVYYDTQKRDTRGESVTQERTGDPVYCPVVACAAVVRAMDADGCSPTDEVYWFKDHKGRRRQLVAKFASTTLKTFVASIEDTWNILPHEVGLHSWRSSSAMAMYLVPIPTATIMLLGRWSSDAFLRYIRPQADNFSAGVAKGMIGTKAFIHVPNAERREDPRTHDPLLSRAISQNGGRRSFVSDQGALRVWS